MKKTLFYILSAVLGFFILLLCIRGLPGNPDKFELNNSEWKEGGPFELSPERGRFALTYTIVEDRSFYFSLPVARFITPDLGYYNHRFVSLFAPGVSILAIPGYVIGKAFNASQVGAFTTASIFAILNAIFIYLIAKRLEVSRPIAMLAGGAFVFASPAFAYAVSLYQHHVSVFLLLVGFYSILRFKPFTSLSIFWFLWALAFVIDYPNIFLFLPLGLYSASKFLLIEKNKKRIMFAIQTRHLLTLITAIIPMIFFFWFNQASYGDPLKLSGTVVTIKSIDADGVPLFEKDAASEEDLRSQNDNQPITYFNSRNLVNGLYTHLISPDRGIIFYTPFMFLIIPGLYFLYKRNVLAGNIILGLIGVNLLLYSMWGDPWGGWAFGSRYLIPTYAFGSIAIAILADKMKAFKLFWVLFFMLFVYSVSVNTLGALTSNANPPKHEAQYLANLYNREQKYSVLRNWDNLTGTMGTKSYVYKQYFANRMYPYEYYFSIVTVISLFYVVVITVAYPFNKVESTSKSVRNFRMKKNKK